MIPGWCQIALEHLIVVTVLVAQEGPHPSSSSAAPPHERGFRLVAGGHDCLTELRGRHQLLTTNPARKF